MIVVVAPYSPIGRADNPHLGAARKIEIVVSLLSRLDSDIVIVNSAHNEERVQSFRVDTEIIGDVPVREISLPCLNNRQFGKLFNLMQVRHAVNRVFGMGKPTMIWLYNAYAFESLFALTVRKLADCPVVLEFEDWHFSRSRGLNPKPYIDYLLWRFTVKYFDHVFAVNDFLADKMRQFTSQVTLLPGIVPYRLEQISISKPPFNGDDAQIKIGYFGGLTQEKGADLILRLARKLPNGYCLEVTGGGGMEPDFIKASSSNPVSLRYHGKVSDVRLYELIAECDVILNPHSHIMEMHNGVFPFKVVEAIASGRLLISTPLPDTSLESVLQGVHFVENDCDAILAAVIDAKAIYQANKHKIKNGALEAVKLFGEIAFIEHVDKSMANRRVDVVL